ncbi:CheR family methyltransferase [Patulibacter sp.]|uniref:CheR family methyltransferase n=1 Tax=Patulibacter sp. TaxID=1912859 RepID=UPI00271FFD76|nr:CheR family methyltransferase [Patulibacter sp.]MDO9409498.1 CheR family methyltransferase [Patulibacter sp.]
MVDSRPRAEPVVELPPAAVLRTLGAACGLDLGSFRPAHVARTIDRAVERLHLAGPEAVARAVRADPAVRARLRRAIAVSTSGMWRDPEQFELLDRLLHAEGRPRRPLRVWSLGASDGSELCSVALLLGRRDALTGAFLLGSDLLPENVALARERRAERLDPAAQAIVRFEQRDVTTSAPTGSWDVVLCRNVLIHLSPDARRATLDHAVGALAPGGLLLLGRSERLLRDGRRGLDDAGPNAYRRVA